MPNNNNNNEKTNDNNLDQKKTDLENHHALDRDRDIPDADSPFYYTISDNNITDFTDNSEKTNKERMKEIIQILGKHKAIESLITSKHPERIKEAFEELGPTFIKNGTDAFYTF